VTSVPSNGSSKRCHHCASDAASAGAFPDSADQATGTSNESGELV